VSISRQQTYLLARDLFVKTMLTEQKEYMVQADKTLWVAAFSAAATAAAVGVSTGWGFKGAISTSLSSSLPVKLLR
jgi:Tfp pilus assembly protein PilZ